MKLVSCLKIFVAGSTSVSFFATQKVCYYKRSCRAYTHTPTDEVEAGYTPWNFDWNRASLSGDGGAKRTTAFYVVRNGEIDRPHGRLTETGRRQAQLCGQHLKNSIEKYTSVHPALTAAYSGHDPGIRETCEIALENILGRQQADLDVRYSTALDPAMPHRPSPHWDKFGRKTDDQIHAAKREIDDFIHRFMETRPLPTPAVEVIFCDGVIGRYIHAKMMQLPLDTYMRFGFRNCGISCYILKKDNKVTCNRYNDTGYLPICDVTGSFEDDFVNHFITV